MKLQKKAKVALIGAGGIADTHAQAFIQLKDDVDFAVVCESNEERGKAFLEKYGIGKLYGDYREVLARRDIDIVDICTPNFSHSAMICEALRAGKWALCEKPVGGSLKEMDDILAAEKETGMRSASIFQMRFGRGFSAVRDLIRPGLSGRPLIGTCETIWYRGQKDYYDPVPWRGSWQGATGGALVTLAIHAIDLFLPLMGEPECVTAEAAVLNHQIEVDDCVAATVRFKNGAMGSVNVTSCSHNTCVTRLQAAFENLSAISMDNNISTKPWKISSNNADVQKKIEECQARWQASIELENHAGQMSHFIRTFRDKSDPIVSIREARRSIELIAGIYKSAITGRKTEFPISRDDPFYKAMNGGQQLRGATKRNMSTKNLEITLT